MVTHILGAWGEMEHVVTLVPLTNAKSHRQVRTMPYPLRSHSKVGKPGAIVSKISRTVCSKCSHYGFIAP